MDLKKTHINSLPGPQSLCRKSENHFLFTPHAPSLAPFSSVLSVVPLLPQSKYTGGCQCASIQGWDCALTWRNKKWRDLVHKHGSPFQKKKREREREREKKKKTAAETWRREWCQIPPFSLRLGRGGGVLRGWRKRGKNKRQQLRKRLWWRWREMKMWRERTSAPGDKNKAQGVSKW